MENVAGWAQKRSALEDRSFAEKFKRQRRKQPMAGDLKLLVWESSHEQTGH